MNRHLAWAAVLLAPVIASGCVSGQKNTRYVEIGDMLPCEMLNLADGSKLTCEVEFVSTNQRGGRMTASDPATNEAFTGQFRSTLSGGGSSTGVVRDSWGWTTGTVKTTSEPTSASAMGFLKGDQGTIVEVALDLVPVKSNSDGSYLFFNGQGTATDNHGERYQVYFGY